MADSNNKQLSASFDINQIAKSFPEHAETMLLDRYLVDRETASARVFRVYRPVPAHYHEHCDEFLYVLSGRGKFWMDSPDKVQEYGPGTFLSFGRRTVHSMPEIVEGPVVFLSVDVPKRHPTDIIFVNPDDGTAQTFIQQVY